MGVMDVALEAGPHVDLIRKHEEAINLEGSLKEIVSQRIFLYCVNVLPVCINRPLQI